MEFKNERYRLMLGDCLDVMKSMPDNSVDSIVTDPPYGLSFMGKKWDYDVPSVEIWAECLRILKPGGHLLSFAGTRTQHRMAVNIEDAGFEIRDMVSFLYDTNETAQALIESLSPEQLKLLDASFGRDGMLAWTYGSGFPKSMDVSKAVDSYVTTGKSDSLAIKDVNLTRPGEAIIRHQSQNGHRGFVGSGSVGASVKRDEPATEQGGNWRGWGTALKPALEPITVARKPFKGTVASNVLAHGTGALNIDGCRVGETDGRWPANLIHDGSDDVCDNFPANAGAAAPVKGTEDSAARTGNVTGKRARVKGAFHGDSGSAARFFYCAKASRKDRNEGLQDPGPQFQHGATLRKVENTDTKGNTHPTVKPTELMAYLCRLVTPPGGVVLDPFMGSGSTGKAAMREGFQFIGIEREEQYLEIARARISAASNDVTPE